MNLVRAAAGLLAAVAPAACAPASAAPPPAPPPARAWLVTNPEPCPTTVTVIAHQDDDLLFINPSISDDLAAGRCVVTVFLTAGDAGRDADYWQGREAGAMAAYAAMAGRPGDWTADRMRLAGHDVASRTLGPRVTLLFLRLPDAHGRADRAGQSLERLWRGRVPAVHTVDDGDGYSRGGLIATLTAALDAYRPDQIRTLDFAGRYGDGDHADHHTAGYFTEAAQRTYARPHRLTGYLGYPVSDQPANLTTGVRDIKLGFFLDYAAHDPRVCATAAACLANFYAPRFSRSIMRPSLRGPPELGAVQ